MKTTIHFSKTFTDGMLKGITVNDKISFPNKKSADIWIKAVKRNEKELGCIFKVIK